MGACLSKQTFFAELACLPQGWRRNVKISVVDGRISTIETETTPDDAQKIFGPLVPAVANLHSHAFQRVMAGMTEQCLDPKDSFWSWRDLMYRLVQQVSPDDVRVIATNLYIELLKNGFTQVAEFQYLHHDQNGRPYANVAEIASQLVTAASASGIGMTLLPVLYAYSGFARKAPTEGQKRFINSVDSYLAIQGKCINLTESSMLNNVGVCFHSLRAVDQEQMTTVLETAPANCPIHIHISEQVKEVEDCYAWSGQRPVAWLANHFELDERWCLVHATHIDRAEIQALINTQVTVGICPTTEANLGDGTFPGENYCTRGGAWGVGTDSHVGVSLVGELRSLEYSQRLKHLLRNRLYTPDLPRVGDFLFQHALAGGARACNQKMGLAEGSRADFLVLDHNNPFIGASEPSDIINRWVFADTGNLIKHVYVAGKKVIDDQKHPLDESSREQFMGLLKRLW